MWRSYFSYLRSTLVLWNQSLLGSHLVKKREKEIMMYSKETMLSITNLKKYIIFYYIKFCISLLFIMAGFR